MEKEGINLGLRWAIKNPKLALSSLMSGKHEWKEKQERDGIKRKNYEKYDDYTKHQKSKLSKINKSFLKEYDVKYRETLRERLKEQNVVKSKMNVLCLAARIGTEVKSFLDLGCFAIGLDLNPGDDNKYVVTGDFHDIQFPDNVVDVVFSNSLDHTFDLKKLIKEIKRVLKPGGFLILEIGKGEDEGSSPGPWEATSWKKIDDVVDIFIKSDFTVTKKVNIKYPWEGQHICLKLGKTK